MLNCCRVLFVVATLCLTDGVHKEARQDRATSVVQHTGRLYHGIPVFPYRQKTTIPVKVASNRKILTIIKNHRLAAAYIKLIGQSGFLDIGLSSFVKPVCQHLIKDNEFPCGEIFDLSFSINIY